MTPFKDPRAEQLYAVRACPSLPPDLWAPAYRLIRLLLASRIWGDVAAFTLVARLPDNRYIAPAHAKWGVSFEWTDGRGAHAIALQRV